MPSKQIKTKHNNLKKEWAVLFKKSTAVSRKKKRDIKKKLNQKKTEEEEIIRQWHMICYKRNDSNEDFDEHIKASINPPPGAYETLDHL